MENFTYYFRDYNDDDYDFVYEAKKVAYKKYVELNWGKWDEDAQKDMFKEFINTYGKDIKIIMIDNIRIGFYHGEYIDNNGYEIGNICIIPEYQGRGIGTKILKEEIAKHSDKNIYLRFFKQNPVGKLYERLGFEMLEEMKFHYKMMLKNK